jgi:signal transduction histidine kinase
VIGLVAADYRQPLGPIVTALVLTVAAALQANRSEGPLGDSLALALGLLATAPIAVIRRFPRLAVGIVLTASAGFVVFGRLSWSTAAVVGWLMVLAASPLVLTRRLAVTAFVLTELAVLAATFSPGQNVTPWDASAAEALAVIAAWGGGELVRARRQAAAEQAAAAARVRDLSERDVIASERTRIARELHDVVAHHVSMIAVRAATARYSVPGMTAASQEAFAEIAEEARAALTELRVVLGVLRSPDGGVPGRAEAAPQPQIADLANLLERVASLGMRATLDVTGEVRPLPGSVELCCYRVVQEALTNAGRHAPGSSVHVLVSYEPDALTVQVSNKPPVGIARHEETKAASARAGYGLTGLRERVAMLRGQFHAGGEGDGGFLVTARLPAGWAECEDVA